MSNRRRTGPRTRGGNSAAPPQTGGIDVDLNVAIDVDLNDDDDDVMISSPRSFAEAKINSRRNRGRAEVVDLDADRSSGRLNNNNMNIRVPGHQQVINLESRTSNSRDYQGALAWPPSPPPAVPEPVFNCPVCMGPFVEEVSTKCGHIFCRTCIKAAVAAQKKCPTCRRKMTMKDTIKIFLPKVQEKQV